jgi:hypothetical protein
MRLVIDEDIGIPMTLWSADAFAENRHDSQIVLGVFYGLMLVMMLYNLFVFLSLRDSAYLYYVIYMVMITIWCAHWNGLAREYLWPERSPGFYRLDVALTIFPWCGIFLFIRTFLLTRLHVPRIDRILRTLIAVNLIIAILALADQYLWFLPIRFLFQQAETFFVFAVGIIVWRQGFRPARYFVVAWFALLCGLTLLLFIRLVLVEICVE